MIKTAADEAVKFRRELFRQAKLQVASLEESRQAGKPKPASSKLPGIQSIPIAHIKLGSWRLSPAMQRTFRDLTRSINSYGLRKPVRLHQVGEVADGYLRIRACENLGHKTILALVY